MSVTPTYRAFTLIELLIVIAILGILTSVVLSSLSIARFKAKDVGVRANMSGIVTQAALYQEANSSYGNSGGNNCTTALFSDSLIQQGLAAIDVANNGAAKECYALDTLYALAVTRPVGNGFTPPTVYWCAESTGKKCGIDVTTVLSSGSCGCP